MTTRSPLGATATTTNSSANANANANASVIAPSVPMLVSGGANAVPPPRTSKNYGPPTLQSDTVVFQAAKIPMSSARHTAPSAVLSSHGGRGQSASYHGPPAHSGGGGGRYPPPPPVRRDELYRGLYAQEGATASPRHGENNIPSPQSAQHLQQRHPAHAMGGRGHNQAGYPQNDRARYMEERERSEMVAAKKPRVQRQPRPSSTESANGSKKRTVRLTVTVIKEGDKLGFGIRNDANRRLKVSTLQSNTTASKSSLKIGDTLLSVNGIDLHNLGFLEVIQQLKATKPGELVFDIERVIDDDGVDSSTHTGDTIVTDVPPMEPETELESARFVPQDQPTPLRENQKPHGPMPSVAAGPHQFHDQSNQMQGPPMKQSTGPVSGEPRTKRPRPAGGMTPSQVEMEIVRVEKQHKTVMNALALELKKERTEKMNLEEKNVALRRRLQNMLIECDEVRVKASSTVALIKDQAQHEIQELTRALQEARARMRLQDRGPDVARTDSIVNDLVAARDQLNRLRRVESERSTAMTNRFNSESRQAEREALRTRDRLISMFQSQLREAARRHYSNTGVKSTSSQSPVVIQLEGFRRLAFAKLFSLPSSFEWYVSEEYLSPAPVRHTLQSHDGVLDVFGNSLCHEERAGLFIVASAPMTVSYDPVNEKLTVSCPWTEQNQIRELARNFRF